MVQNEASIAIEKLLNYFRVSTISALANKLGISQPSISAWKKNNYISAIQKKCRELGIYGEIFGQNQNFENNYGNNAQNVYGSQAQSATANSVDPATMALFLEQYQKAEKEGRIKEFRLHIMEFAGE